MEENKKEDKDDKLLSSSSSNLRPSITLPPRSSMDIFGGSASPGPMTLVSGFFSENYPESEHKSFSQLLQGAMSPVTLRPRTDGGNGRVSETNGGESGGVDFRVGNGPVGPDGFVFTVPPGLSPGGLLNSPGMFFPNQVSYGMSYQQALAQVTNQAAESHTQVQMPTEYPSSSGASAATIPQFRSFTSNSNTHQQIPPPIQDRNNMRESSDLSDQVFQPSSFVADKPADDGYNWRKYGQKQVKGSEYPRSYYKCTHPSCPVKKKVERSFDGQVTEIIYKGQHNHQQPQSKRAKDTGNANGSSSNVGQYDQGLEDQNGELNRSNDGMPENSFSTKDQESSQAISGSSDSEEVGDAETRMVVHNEDEPEAKRRNTEVRGLDQISSQRTLSEPKIIVQTTSEVDLLDDGYRWRKYGQKVVKGNPYPRSYYKCTSPGCNVRKHVERAASDPKAVLTTYEGKHTHDVPVAKHSSHSIANNTVFRPVPDRHALIRRENENDRQPIGLLQFKEEQLP